LASTKLVHADIVFRPADQVSINGRVAQGGLSLDDGWAGAILREAEEIQWICLEGVNPIVAP
jgi:hypothetical protein